MLNKHAKEKKMMVIVRLPESLTLDKIGRKKLDKSSIYDLFFISSCVNKMLHYGTDESHYS